ncbi:MAG: GNAT family protein [Hyphomicrobiales bacterium]|jgi:ribosomal-protein-alanine N-acetyltransferase|nr:GNAT family protein [Hyphomicrobiales bacterium]
MALFRFTSDATSRVQIKGDGVMLRQPVLDDYEAWSSVRQQSRAFLEPWEPLWSDEDLTKRAFRQRVKRAAAESDADEAYAFMIFRMQDQALIGGVTLGLVRRGVAQACTMGYWLGEPYGGHGYMTRAVKAVAKHAFEDLHLRRIEAACVPANGRSRALLERVGFQREGYARQYLCINGRWEDHLLYALLASDPRR